MEQVDKNIQAAKGRWNFSQGRALDFDGHVEKSIPFYHEGHELVIELSHYFVKENSRVYDLGCSTGTLLGHLFEAHQDCSPELIGIESEKDMAAMAQQKLSPKIQVLQDQLESCQFEKNDLTVSYYTIQFIPPRHRQELFNRVFEALNWGGAFIFFEKVRAPDARFQDYLTGLYDEFKFRQGFSGSEIMAKSRSLRGVLEPFSTQANYDFLKRAGFADYVTVFKYLCFEGILAIK